MIWLKYLVVVLASLASFWLGTYHAKDLYSKDFYRQDIYCEVFKRVEFIKIDRLRNGNEAYYSLQLLQDTGFGKYKGWEMNAYCFGPENN